MRVIAIVLAVLVMCSVASASTTGRGRYITPVDPLTEWLNTNDEFYHTHDYQQTSKYKAPLGFGVDLTIYEFVLGKTNIGLGVDTNYDMNNGVWGLMGKCRINISDQVKAWLSR